MDAPTGKAWWVSAIHPGWDDEFNNEIVWAPTRGKAFFGAQITHDYGLPDALSELRIRRAPGFDNKRDCDHTYYENGWSFECGGCPKTIDQSRVDDGEATVWFDKAGNGYCSGFCWLKFKERMIDWERQREQARQRQEARRHAWKQERQLANVFD